MHLFFFIFTNPRFIIVLIYFKPFTSLFWCMLFQIIWKQLGIRLSENIGTSSYPFFFIVISWLMVFT